MKTTLLAAAFSVLAQTALAVASRFPSIVHNGVKAQAHPNPENVGNGTFDQLLDHSDPSKGTFQQRYWWDASNWKGPGSPVFLFNPGETAADEFLGYLSNGTIPGLYAQLFEGAAILIEHRYWGKSIPYDTLNAETMQLLNIDQASLDMTYFAQNVALEFDTTNHGGANAANAPWILVGGSYSGALSAWVSQIDPGTFFAYHASSAVVEAIYHFWQYFEPVEEALPRNCSADVRAVVAYIDQIFANGPDSDRQNLQAMFGLEMLTHPDDFAEQVAGPIAQWQDNQQAVFDFCDHIETYGNATPSAAGVGLDTALKAYADYVNSTAGEQCRESDCDTYDNPQQYNQPNDLTSGDRQWSWLLCDTPFGWWQTGPSTSDGTNIISSLLTPEHFQRLCPLMFPETNGYVDGSTRGFTEENTNSFTRGGWQASFADQRVMFCNGQFDPWRSATVSSDYRPSGPLASTAETPIFIVEGGVHVPDLIINPNSPDQVSVVEQEIAVMDAWLREYSA